MSYAHGTAFGRIGSRVQRPYALVQRVHRGEGHTMFWWILTAAMAYLACAAAVVWFLHRSKRSQF